MTDQTNDPFASAMNAKERPPIYWGNLLVDAFFCVLEKGPGKIPFDPQIHSPERKVTAVSMSLLPIPEMNLNFPIERCFVAEFGEWVRFVLPSLRDLGVELAELIDKYVKIELIPTGRMYQVKDANGNPTGEERPERTWRFLKVYESGKDCLSDYLSGNVAVQEDEEIPFLTKEQEQATQKPKNDGRNPEKETAYRFLEVLVDNAVKGQTDLDVVKETFSNSLENIPLVKKYFNVESEETVALIMKRMGGEDA
jgi:hypothetical protein